MKWEEFNRQPAAGLTTVVRLQEMLDASVFAFLVLTAEDEHVDGSQHALENVVHEVGLFQGRLGFSRAIVLMGRRVRGILKHLWPYSNRLSSAFLKQTPQPVRNPTAAQSSSTFACALRKVEGQLLASYQSPL